MANRRYDWAAIQRCHDEGLTVRECAKLFGFSPDTWTEYARRGKLFTRANAKCRRRQDWSEVQRWHDAGHSRKECIAKFKFSVVAWYKAIKRGALKPASNDGHPNKRRYDWAAVQTYYDEGHSIRACCEKFGFTADSWNEARKRGDVFSRQLRTDITTLLSRSKSRASIKRRLLQEGFLKNECSRCGITEWRGKPISIQIDHINGINDDYRLDNLRMLCANCHSLTPTYGRRNARRKRVLPDEKN